MRCLRPWLEVLEKKGFRHVFEFVITNTYSCTDPKTNVFISKLREIRRTEEAEDLAPLPVFFDHNNGHPNDSLTVGIM